MSSPLIPATVLADVLHTADLPSEHLSVLADEIWPDAIVLATPFWVPRTGRLNTPVNLAQGISPLVAASIRFDPDRELIIAAEGFSPGVALDEATKDVLATARRVRVLSTFSAAAVPALVQLMPSLTAVHLATAEQLTPSMRALVSLVGLNELHITNCRAMKDLWVLAPFRKLKVLNLGGCFNLRDASGLTTLENLRDLLLRGCSHGTDLSDVGMIPLTERVVDQSEHDPWGNRSNSELLGTYVNFMRSDDPDENMHGTLMIRKLLSEGDNRPFDEVVEEGCVPHLASHLLRDEFPKLQFQAAWALTNISSADIGHIANILKNPGAIRNLIRLLRSPDEDCRDQACWAIANLAGYSAGGRDSCLDHGALPPLVAVVTAGGLKEARNAAWALTNLCRGKPLPAHEQVAPALPVLVGLLDHGDDHLVGSAAWAFSYLSDGTDDHIQHVLNTGCLPRLVELLTWTSSAVVLPVIKAIGNIATGNDHQKQAVINTGALSAFRRLINHEKESIRYEVCWALSYITGGGHDQIQAVRDANLFPVLMKSTKATMKSTYNIKKEALWAIRNATKRGSVAHIQYLVELGVLPCLCDQLTVLESKVVAPALQAVAKILEVGERNRKENQLESNAYADEVVNCSSYEHIEELQSHSDLDIQQQAKSIMEVYLEALPQKRRRDEPPACDT